MDLINEQAGEKRETDNTKQQNVAQARDDLEKLNVGKGEIMALMKLADEMYEKYVLKKKNALRLKYVKEVSFKTDTKLFFSTVFKVVDKTLAVLKKIFKK